MKEITWACGSYRTAEAKALADALGVGLLTAKILCVRGLNTPALARSFLDRDLSRMHDPMLLRDMDRAVARICAAMASGDPIAVYGDYDVDGITSTYILTDFLRRKGVDCRYYIPDRFDDGYGVNLTSLVKLRTQGVRLVITVDTGITAVSETAAAKTLGLDLVICDHHECKETLPNACAVVNPHRADCQYPFSQLAGVGVAFQLIRALCSPEELEEVQNRYLPFVTLGTVADIMPLVDENRAIVANGIDLLKTTKHVGLSALIEESGAKRETMDSTQIGFVLAPRMNAAGRMTNASQVVELFLEQDAEKARAAAKELCELNSARQALETKIMEQAEQELPQVFDPARDNVIVLAGEGWHHGVIGIVASRLSERYHCPAILISLDGETGKGSGRSVKGYHLYDMLSEASDCLVQFGGHDLAVGVSVSREQIPALRARLNELADRVGEVPHVLDVDLEVEPADLTVEDVDGLAVLEPFGSGNPYPVLCMYNQPLQEVKSIGQGKHTKLSINGLSGVFFRMTPDTLNGVQGDRVSVAFRPEINTYYGRSVQLLVQDLCQEDDVLCACDAVSADLTTELARAMHLEYKQLGAFWRYLKANGDARYSVGALSRSVQLSPYQVATALAAFDELDLICAEFCRGTVSVRFQSEKKVELSDSALLTRVEQAAQ